jgi:hypothetical protein
VWPTCDTREPVQYDLLRERERGGNMCRSEERQRTLPNMAHFPSPSHEKVAGVEAFLARPGPEDADRAIAP